MYRSQDIVYSALFSVVLVFNIAGNSLVIYIITNERGMKTPTNYLMLNLAVADLLFGVFLVPQYTFLPFFRDAVPDGVLGDWLCKLLLSSNIAWMAACVSLLTILALSVERYFAVCRPHSFRQRFSLRNIKIFILISWIYSFLWSLPIGIWSTHDDTKEAVCKRLALATKLHAIYVAIEMFLSVSLMIICLVKICISLWCKRMVEPATGQREITERKKKKKVTLCVLAVVFTFLLCWMPSYVVYLMRMFSHDLPNHFTSTGSFRVSVLMMTVNASLNPLLYRFSSFKSVFKTNFCCSSSLSRAANSSSEFQDNNQDILP